MRLLDVFCCSFVLLLLDCAEDCGVLLRFLHHVVVVLLHLLVRALHRLECLQLSHCVLLLLALQSPRILKLLHRQELPGEELVFRCQFGDFVPQVSEFRRQNLVLILQEEIRQLLVCQGWWRCVNGILRLENVHNDQLLVPDR